MGDLLVNIIAFAILFLIPAWRIFSKAGFEPATAMVVLIPFVGPLIALLILAIAEWPRNRDFPIKKQGDA
jgi:hypothetical protein